MDNFSHSLAGLVTAELALALRRRRGEPSPLWPRVAWATAVAANNLPDADFAYTWITGGVLGSLLHHRGHTHTLVFALLLAPIPLLIPWLWGRRRQIVWTRADWASFGGLSLVGTVLHIVFDGTNDYGVHPFWPLWNGWVYGDTIFIIEPWFWVVTVPLLVASATHRVARVLWSLPVVLILVAAFLLPIVPLAVAITLLAVATTLTLISRRLARTTRVLAMVALSAFAVVVFTLSGRIARAEVRQALAAQSPELRVHDVTSIPLPSNPFCWTGLAVLSREDAYLVKRYSAAPLGVISAEACPRASFGETRTAPWRPATNRSTGDVHWVEEHHGSAASLRRLAKESCHAQAAFRFLRAPFLEGKVLGDLRYDREPDEGFTELELTEGEPCPRFIPPWGWPQADLLR